jgi:hypothetical protein
MKMCLLLACVLAGATVAAAGELPYTAALSCGSVSNLVRAKGAVLLRTGLNKFNRYVIDGAYCGHDDRLVPGVVTTKDNPSCFVGYRCGKRAGAG